MIPQGYPLWVERSDDQTRYLVVGWVEVGLEWTEWRPMVVGPLDGTPYSRAPHVLRGGDPVKYGVS